MRPHAAPALIACLSVLCGACGESSTGPEETASPQPTDLVIVNGDDQQDTVTRTLDDTLHVRLIDDDGDGVSGAVISWVITDGGGEVFAPSTGTNEDGLTQNRWTLGPPAGSQAVEARWVNPSTGEAQIVGEFTATALPDRVTQIEVEADSATEADGDTVTVGDSIQYSATALDEHGNINSESGFVWGVSDSSVASIDGSGLVVTDAKGETKVTAEKEGVVGIDSLVVQAETSLAPPSVSISSPADGASFEADVQAPQVTDTEITFGRGNAGFFLDGDLDEIRIWDVARNQTDIDGSKSQRLAGTESGLVAYWRLDEGQGDTASDSTGNGHAIQLGSSSGSDASDPGWIVPGAVGGAKSSLEFSGDQHTQTPDSDSLDLTSTFTIEAWINPANLPGSGSFQHLVSKWGSSSEASYVLSLTDQRLRLNLHDPSASPDNTPVHSSTSLSEGSWQHVAATFDNGEVRLYIDGTLDTVATGKNVPQVTSTSLFLGQSSANLRHYRGFMDEVRIWSVVRSEAEIDGSKDQQLGGNEAGLVAYWPMNEGTGDEAADSSGNGHDMRLGDANGSDSADPAWAADALTPSAALQFDGSDDEARTPDADDLDLQDTWTLEAWVRPDAISGNQKLIDKWGTASEASYEMALKDGLLRVFTRASTGGENTGVHSTQTLQTDTWQHVAAAYDNGKLSLYIDGQLDKIVEGDTIQFEGSGNDPDGGSVSLTWRSSLQGVIGTGSSLQRHNLLAGNHTIWLIGEDDEGARDSTSISISLSQKP